MFDSKVGTCVMTAHSFVSRDIVALELPNALFGVAKKTRREWAEICPLASKLLLECRTVRRSASISRQAAPLRQKPFAIVKWDGEDRPTVAGRPSSHAYCGRR